MSYKSLAIAFAVIGTQAIQITKEKEEDLPVEEPSVFDLMAQTGVDAEYEYGSHFVLAQTEDVAHVVKAAKSVLHLAEVSVSDTASDVEAQLAQVSVSDTASDVEAQLA